MVGRSVTIAKRDVRILLAVLMAVLAALGVLWKCGVLGVKEQRVVADAEKKLEIDEKWWSRSEGDKKQVTGIFYDYGNAPLKGVYYCYVNRSGFSYGFFLQKSGNLDRDTKIQKVDLGQCGAAYVSLNSQQAVKVIRDDGTEPAVKSISPYAPFVVISQKHDCKFRFYDKNGKEIPVFASKTAADD